MYYKHSDLINMAVKCALKKRSDYNYKKADVLVSNNGLCLICNKADATEVDHIIPMNKTFCGLDTRSNVQPVCRKCNIIKGGKCHTSYVDPELRQYIDEVVKKAKEFYDSL